MSSIPVRDHGLTDRLDPLLGERFGPWLARVDARAGVRVDDRGIHVRQLIRTQHVPWEKIDGIVLDNRLDVVLAAATRFLPVRRVPVVGGVLTDAVRSASATVTRTVVPGARDRAGWTVATVQREGMLHGDVDVEGGAWLTALLHPSVTEAVTAHAAMRHIPLERR